MEGKVRVVEINGQRIDLQEHWDMMVNDMSNALTKMDEGSILKLVKQGMPERVQKSIQNVLDKYATGQPMHSEIRELKEVMKLSAGGNL